MMRIDEEMLMAFVDGELDEVARARIARAAEEDEALARRIEGQRRLKARLAERYGPIIEEEVPERLRTMLETNVVPLRAPVRAPLWRSAAALAATLVIGLAIGRAWPDATPVRAGGDALYAEGALAETLERQLASTQDPAGDTRVGISFAAQDGRLCRTFEAPVLTGLACRAPDGWQLVLTAPGASAAGGEYRQAGAAIAVMEAAQEMMAGEPFDAAAEQAARDRGWRD